MSASVERSSVSRYARSAPANSACSRQPGASGQPPPAGSKQAAMRKSVSPSRTTSPTRICRAGRASRTPPPRPRTVSSSPARARSATIFITALRASPWLWASSATLTRRPAWRAQYISTRRLWSVYSASRTPRSLEVVARGARRRAQRPSASRAASDSR